MNEFYTFLLHEKKLSSDTADAYCKDIGRLEAFCGHTAARCTAAELADFLTWQQSRGYTASTVARYVTSLQTYFRYLCTAGQRKTDPSSGLIRPAADRKLPQAMTPGEVEQLLSVPNADTPKGCRDKAILELLYATGVKVSELVDMNIDTVNLRRGLLYLQTGAHSRTIPIGKPAQNALRIYLKDARLMLLGSKSDTALFLSCEGSRISRQGVWKLIRKYTAEAGIDKIVTPHTLRHSFAAHMLANGADLSSIQTMMGFLSPASTAIYTQMAENEILSVYKRAHPRAN